jgi:hypothetical protein
MKTQQEIEQLAEKYAESFRLKISSSSWHEEKCDDFINGYTQCQEDMAKETNNKCYHPLPYRLAKSDTNFECTLCGKFI